MSGREMTPGLAAFRQGPYISMGPPPSRSPSMISVSTNLTSSDTELQLQQIQSQLRASQEDLRLALDTIQFKDDQIRAIRRRHDQERQAYEAEIAELRRRQQGGR